MEVLVAVAEAGSMHKAANRLGMAQPAVSRLLSDVERTVGSRLFERAASGSSLTAKGQALVAHARFLLRGMARMDEVAQEHAASVRFGCIPRAMHTLMPFILNRMGPAPVHRLHVVEDASGVLSAALERGGLDMAVMRHVSGAAGIGEGLLAERLYDERPLVVCSTSHALARRRSLALHALAAQRWVMPSAETTTRAVLDRFWQEQGLAPIAPVIETRSFESSVALVASTDLLSAIPESIARMYEGLGRIKVLPVSPPLPGTSVLLVHDAKAAGDPVLQDFRALVTAAAAQARRANALRA